MAKNFIVLDFLNAVGMESDDIPVTIKYGTETVCQVNSLRWLFRHGSPYILEAKIKEIDICKDGIIIRIQPKIYNSKI